MNSFHFIATISALIVIVNGQISPKFEYSTGNKDNKKSDDQHDIITFPEDVEEEQFKNVKPKQENMIPLSFIEKINNVNNVTEFFDEFIDKDSVDPRDAVVPRFGEEMERSIGIQPIPAGCIPDNAVVSLIPTSDANDPTIMYFPTCTRVKRCSGCCSHPLLSCQPIETKTKAFTVIKSQYVGGTKNEYRGKEVVVVDEHIKCKCDCKIKAKDCTKFQTYDPSNCMCVCNNYDDQSKCASRSDKIWDSTNCTCRCRETSECTSGTFFNENFCGCSRIDYDWV